MQNRIPCTYMRAGTSRGPFLDLRDLPDDPGERDKVLLRIMGSPDAKQIDGLGGATVITSKVVMVQPSAREGIDVDYLFAEVFIDQPIVDSKPTCGNMMTGVGPFAVERGWVEANDPETRVMIYNFNTDSTIEVVLQTPNKMINYCYGDLEIDGVPGTGAPVLMNLYNLAGGATSKLFPTGSRKDMINNVAVSIVDAGNLMVLLAAEELELTGREDRIFFEEDNGLMTKIETIRLKAGLLAGLGDVSNCVLPKVGILSPPLKSGTIKSQYFTPHALHPSHAVSGAICISTACKAKGTVADEIARLGNEAQDTIIVEHTCGVLPVQILVTGVGDDFTVVKAGILRTARKIMDGFVYY